MKIIWAVTEKETGKTYTLEQWLGIEETEEEDD